MKTQFWAKRGRNVLGPFDTRKEALDAFRAAYPFKGPAYMARAKANDILTGYGTFGPGADMQWHHATETEN